MQVIKYNNSQYYIDRDLYFNNKPYFCLLEEDGELYCDITVNLDNNCMTNDYITLNSDFMNLTPKPLRDKVLKYLCGTTKKLGEVKQGYGLYPLFMLKEEIMKGIN